jgi:hypothetical protein
MELDRYVAGVALDLIRGAKRAVSIAHLLLGLMRERTVDQP